jgi:hypothetical protein
LVLLMLVAILLALNTTTLGLDHPSVKSLVSAKKKLVLRSGQ